MTDTAKPFAFSQFVPGFDFLRSLTGGGAGGAVPGLPSLSNWVAPTLSVEELDKRIDELKTVQYWLEQNGHALKATIQALEVQRMTLSTLKGMNVQMEDLAKAFARGTADAANAMREAAGSASVMRASAPAPAPPPAEPVEAQREPVVDDAPEEAGEPADADAPDTESTQSGHSAAEAPASTDGAQGTTAGVIDPLQWWNSLTQQFQQIASNAMQDAAQRHAPAASADEGAAPRKAKARADAAAPARKRAASPRASAKRVPVAEAKPNGPAGKPKAPTRAPAARKR